MSRSGRRIVAAGVLVASTIAVASAAWSVRSSGAASPAAPDPGAWTVYHGDGAGTGVASSVGPVDTAAPAWRSPTLDGDLYGEPLVAGGVVYVATEADRVYALSASTGAVVWSTGLGAPVPASSLPCGDVQPTVGITGTPVLDVGRGEVFVVADELVRAGPVHMLVGLNASTGQVEMTEDVDPPGARSSALLQRTGLTLDAGQVVFGFGGNYGDCSTYRGWVVAVAETGGPPRDFAVDAGPGQEQGAIWMGGGAPAVDAGGNIWVSAGNGSVTSSGHPYDDSDSVLELSPDLRLLQFFAPTEWAADNAADRDLSMEPVLLGDGQVVVAGKSRIAYLLDGADLGGIGGQRAELASVCSDDVDGGAAAAGSVVYLPCTTGVVAVRVSASPTGITMLWSSGAGGGPPIEAGGLVWTLAGDGTLSGLDPATGSVRQQVGVGAPANHFPTPSAGDGLLLVPTAERVVAFRAAASGSATVPSTAAPSPGARRVPPRPADTTGTGLPAAATAGLAVAGALAAVGAGVVLGLAVAFLRRRRTG